MKWNKRVEKSNRDSDCKKLNCIYKSTLYRLQKKKLYLADFFET